MSGYSQKKKHKKQVSTKKYTKDTNVDLVYSDLSQSQKNQLVSKLYAMPNQLRLGRFQQILKTNNLSLLKKDQQLTVPKQVLDETWYSLLDYYYNGTNPKEWQNYLETIIDSKETEANITLINACIMLINIGDNTGYDILKRNSINCDTLKSAISYLNREKSQFKIILSRLRSDDKKEARTFEMTLAAVSRQCHYWINKDKITLEEWVGIISDLREYQKSQETLFPNNKRNWKEQQNQE
jgi:hypothetical protein